jgi:hypothetical protein
LTVFVFVLLFASVRELASSPQRLGELAQELAADIYFQLSRENLPEPNLSWSFLKRQVHEYGNSGNGARGHAQFIRLVEH